MTDIIKDLLKEVLKGADMLIALLSLFAVLVYAFWIFGNKSHRTKTKHVIKFALGAVVVTVVIIFIRNWWQVSTTKFSGDKTGILVLRIAGDNDNSLQRDLVDSLLHELTRARLTNFAVSAWDDELDDSRLGLQAAHTKARNTGRRLNAHLVIWGNRIPAGPSRHQTFV